MLEVGGYKTCIVASVFLCSCLSCFHHCSYRFMWGTEQDQESNIRQSSVIVNQYLFTDKCQTEFQIWEKLVSQLPSHPRAFCVFCIPIRTGNLNRSKGRGNMGRDDREIGGASLRDPHLESVWCRTCSEEMGNSVSKSCTTVASHYLGKFSFLLLIKYRSQRSNVLCYQALCYL